MVEGTFEARHLFLSHSSKDADLARRLGEALESAGVKVWCSAFRGEIQLGTAWVEELSRALKNSAGFLILLTRSGLTNWMQDESNYAIVRRGKDSAYRILPVLGKGADTEKLSALIQAQQFLTLSQADLMDPAPAAERIAAAFDEGPPGEESTEIESAPDDDPDLDQLIAEAELGRQKEERRIDVLTVGQFVALGCIAVGISIGTYLLCDWLVGKYLAWPDPPTWVRSVPSWIGAHLASWWAIPVGVGAALLVVLVAVAAADEYCVELLECAFGLVLVSLGVLVCAVVLDYFGARLVGRDVLVWFPTGAVILACVTFLVVSILDEVW